MTPLHPAGSESPRDAARPILMTYCGACHHPNGETPKPQAMAIFRLDEEIFEATMTAENFEGMLGRLDGFGVPADQQVVIRTFVDEARARLARR